MYRVTTSTCTFTLPDNTSSYSIIQVAFRQENITLVKQYENATCPDGMELDGKDVIITLTQAETKAFREGIIQAQVRVLTNDNKAFASQMFNVSVDEVINEVILHV